MKILFINTGPWGTGSFTAIKGLSKYLLQQGHQVKIFFPDAHLKSVDMDEYYSNPKLYHIWHYPISDGSITLPTFPLMLTEPHPRSPYPILFSEMSDEELAFYLLELKKELTALIQDFQPAVIECHHIWYASWILQQMGLEYLVIAHHSDQMGFQEDLKVRPYAIAGAHGAKKILAISEPVKREVLQLYNVLEKKVLVCENGYDKSVFHKKTVDRQALLKNFSMDDIPSNAILINLVGKISLNKGLDVLLQANKYLDPTFNIHFIIIGAGELEPILQSIPADSYTLDNFHFIGQQPPERIADFHNISIINVMPSRSEGFGIACLEAMACGLPVVTTRSGGPEHFAIGRIIDTNAPQQLADAIRSLLTLPKVDYRAVCRQAARVAESFSWESILQKRMSVYESFIK